MNHSGQACRKYATLLFAQAFVLSFSTASAQSVYSLLAEDPGMTSWTRASSGDYFTWRTDDVGFTVMKYDALLFPQWGAHVVPVDEAYDLTRTSGVRTPDGGLCLMGYASMSRIDVVRMDADGSVLWARRLDVSSGSVDMMPNGVTQDIEVSEDGEVFIQLINSWGTGYILKLSEAGNPLWMVKHPQMASDVRSLLPDKDGGCYFAIQPAGTDYETVRIGHLESDGATSWLHRFAWAPGEFMGWRLRYMPGDSVVLMGRSHADFFYMKFSPDGEPSAFRYFQPDVPYSDCPVMFMRDFECASDGRMLMAAQHSMVNYSFLLSLDAAGHFSAGYKLPVQNTDGWSEKFAVESLDALHNEVSIAGVQVRTQDPYEVLRPFGITGQFAFDDLCAFQPMSFTEVDVPLSELFPGTAEEITFVTLPIDMGMQVTNSTVPVPAAENACVAMAIPLAQASAGDHLLVQNLLAAGDALRWANNASVQLRITDARGRVVGIVSTVRASLFDTQQLSAGMYVASFTDRSGALIGNERFVLE